MAVQEGLIALLHVSGLVGVVAAAYVGIDNGRDNRELDNAAFVKARELAIDVVQKLGLDSYSTTNVMRSRKWGRITIIYPACAICVVAKQPLKMGRLHRLCAFLYRQWHLPCFKYFLNHRDIPVTAMMSVISLALFFLVSGWIIWMGETPLDDRVVKGLFVLLTMFMGWILGQGLLALRQTDSRITTKVECLDKKVRERMEKLLMDAETIVAEIRTE